MTDRTVEGLFAHLGLPAPPASPARAETMPWYVEGIVGIGAWSAAMALVSSAVGFLEMVTLQSVWWLSLLGVLALGGAWAVRRRGNGAFVRQFTLACALGGAALVIVGTALPDDGAPGEFAAPTAVAVAALTVPLFRDAAYQFAVVAIACALVIWRVAAVGMPFGAEIVLAVTLTAAFVILFRPIRRLDLRPAALALLIAPVFAVPLALELERHSLGTWPVRGVYGAAMLWLLGVAWREIEAARRPLVLAAGGAALLVAGLLSAGLVFSCVLMLLAFVLGSRALAAVGVVFHAYFLWIFYYDLQATLLVKSGLLVAAGTAMLAVWVLWSRAMRAGGEP